MTFTLNNFGHHFVTFLYLNNIKHVMLCATASVICRRRWIPRLKNVISTQTIFQYFPTFHLDFSNFFLHKPRDCSFTLLRISINLIVWYQTCLIISNNKNPHFKIVWGEGWKGIKILLASIPNNRTQHKKNVNFSAQVVEMWPSLFLLWNDFCFNLSLKKKHYITINNNPF